VVAVWVEFVEFAAVVGELVEMFVELNVDC
jgi:hypothetical protein